MTTYPTLFRSLVAVVMLGMTLCSTARLRADQLTLSVSSQEAALDQVIEVSVMASHARRLGPVQFELLYNDKVLAAEDAEAGALLRGMVHSEDGDSGVLRLAMLTDNAINDDGELMTIKFKVIGTDPAESQLSLANVRAYEYETLDELLVSTEPGQVTITGQAWRWDIIIGVGVVLVILLVILSLRKRK